METIEDVQLLAMAKYEDTVDRFERRDDEPNSYIPDAYLTKRLTIWFSNGRGLSVISGEYTHSKTTTAPFELVPLDSHGALDYGMNLIEDPSNDTVGHCDLKKVMEYAKHVGEYHGV